MPAQEEIGLTGPGVERKKVKAIDDALDSIADCFEKRKSWQDKEAAARALAVQLFHKHELSKYRGPDGKLYELKTLEKVKRAPEPDEEE